MWKLNVYRVCLFALLAMISMSPTNGTNKTACIEKEKSLALLDTAEDLLTKAKLLYPSCGENITVVNDTECGAKEKSLAYLEVAQKLISEIKEHFPACNHPEVIEIQNNRPVDCLDVLANGQKPSGVYTIWPISRLTAEKSLEVYCDMETDGGGWTVIQRRGNFTPQQDFFQDWETYKKGFGSIKRDFWLGNDNIHVLGNNSNTEIRFDLKNVAGEHRFAVYHTFWIDDELSNYTLHISNYRGNAGDCMGTYNKEKFSTKDKRDMDCANRKRSGWWYRGCTKCNMNGFYQLGLENDRTGVYWNEWQEYTSLKSVEIKIRKK